MSTWRAAASRWLAAAATLALAVLGASLAATTAGAEAGAALRGPDAFAGISDPAQRSIALFVEAGKVFLHPRCTNCHVADDHPRQGDDGRPHQPRVRRGPDGLGVPGLRCPACHHDANYDPARMPSAVAWHLAPASMALHGTALSRICIQLKDENGNGGRSVADLVTHVTNDPLVLWAWAPGAHREPAPGAAATFAGLMRAWADTGAECPAP
jgi:hypothetical protein